MAPDSSIFERLDADFRGMAWPGHEYVLGTNKAHQGAVANLPPGTWTVTCYDVVARKARVVNTAAVGRFDFDTPASRAVLYHFQRN